MGNKIRKLLVISLSLICVILMMTTDIFAMQMYVRISTTGKHITLEVEPTDLVGDVKEKVFDSEGIHPEEYYLTYKGEVLEDANTLQDYSIFKDATISLLPKKILNEDVNEPMIDTYTDLFMNHLTGNHLTMDAINDMKSLLVTYGYDIEDKNTESFQLARAKSISTFIGNLISIQDEELKNTYKDFFIDVFGEAPSNPSAQVQGNYEESLGTLIGVVAEGQCSLEEMKGYISTYYPSIDKNLEEVQIGRANAVAKLYDYIDVDGMYDVANELLVERKFWSTLTDEVAYAYFKGYENLIRNSNKICDDKNVVNVSAANDVISKLDAYVPRLFNLNTVEFAITRANALSGLYDCIGRGVDATNLFTELFDLFGTNIQYKDDTTVQAAYANAYASYVEAYFKNPEDSKVLKNAFDTYSITSFELTSDKVQIARANVLSSVITSVTSNPEGINSLQKIFYDVFGNGTTNTSEEVTAAYLKNVGVMICAISRQPELKEEIESLYDYTKETINVTDSSILMNGAIDSFIQLMESCAKQPERINEYMSLYDTYIKIDSNSSSSFQAQRLDALCGLYSAILRKGYQQDFLNLYEKYFGVKHDILHYYVYTYVDGNFTQYEVANNECVSIEDPTKEDSIFEGWYTNQELTNPFDLETPITQSYILYPKFVDDSITVTFVDGTTELNTYTIERNTALIDKPNNPIKEGYTFVGWTFENSDEVMDVTSPLSDSITFYAKWKVNEYSITYKDGDDKEFSGTFDKGYPSNHTFDTDTTLVSPIRDGYTFNGWFKEPSCTTNSKTNVLGGKEYTSDITVYASWSANESKITFDSNQGSEVKTMIGVSDQEIENTTMPTPTRNGYTFVGWYDNAQLSGNVITQLPSSYPIGTKTYYAKWTVDEAYILFEENGGTEVSDMKGSTDLSIQDTSLVVPTREGYSFVGWYNNQQLQGKALTALPSTYPSGITTYYAKWNPNPSYIQFETNGGGKVEPLLGVTDQAIENTTMPSTTKEGYTFIGWYEDEQLTKQVDSLPSSFLPNNITYYAKWNPNEYKITYSDEDKEDFTGSLSDELPESYTYGSEITLPTPTREGYTFVGWKNQEGKFITKIDPTANQDIKLYATWKANESKIVFEENDGSNVQDFIGVTDEKLTTSSLPIPTRDEYTFVGWYDNEQLQGQTITTLPSSYPSGTITYYAKWEKKTAVNEVVKPTSKPTTPKAEEPEEDTKPTVLPEEAVENTQISKDISTTPHESNEDSSNVNDIEEVYIKKGTVILVGVAVIGTTMVGSIILNILKMKKKKFW